MANDKLSQEEIDALLNRNQSEPQTDPEELNDLNHYFSPLEQDAIGEIGNISFGSASTALSTLLNQKVDITTPKVSLLHRDKLADEFPVPHIAIHVKYTDGFQGLNLLVIKMDDAKIIADLMLGGDGTQPDPELNEMHYSAVQEAMNQMMGSAATSLSTMFNQRIDISPPGIDKFDVANGQFKHPVIEEEMLLKVAFKMRVGELIDSEIMQLMPINFATKMVGALLNADGTEEVPAESVETESPAPAESLSQPVPPMPNELQIEHEETVSSPQIDRTESIQSAGSQSVAGQPAAHWQQDQVAFNQPMEPSVQGGMSRHVKGTEGPLVEPVQFTDFDHPPTEGTQPQNLDLLMDIPLQVTVELGRTRRTVQEILELAPGSVVELDKLAGEPVDILVNNKLVAKGEVVVIEENFGVRVTDILSQRDRLQKL